jgi:hypothetical protein
MMGAGVGNMDSLNEYVQNERDVRKFTEAGQVLLMEFLHAAQTHCIDTGREKHGVAKHAFRRSHPAPAIPTVVPAFFVPLITLLSPRWYGSRMMHARPYSWLPAAT